MWWWYTPLVPALGRQKQADIYEFEASLVYRPSSKTAKDTQRTLSWKKKEEINKQI